MWIRSRIWSRTKLGKWCLFAVAYKYHIMNLKSYELVKILAKFAQSWWASFPGLLFIAFTYLIKVAQIANILYHNKITSFTLCWLIMSLIIWENKQNKVPHGKPEVIQNCVTFYLVYLAFYYWWVSWKNLSNQKRCSAFPSLNLYS